MATTANPYQYNVSPGTQGGSGAFGSVPGNISLPNPAADLSEQYPNLSGTNSALSGDILSKLSGQLSPATLQQLQNASATSAVNNGMPGSNAIPGTMPYNTNLESLGLNSEAQQQQGISDYNSTIPTVSGTQTVAPALQANIAEENAINASAPNPAAANSYAQSLYQQYLNSMKGGPGGSTFGGTSRPSTASPILSNPLASPNINPGAYPSTGQGSFYNGQWYPSGSTPTQGLTPPQGAAGGVDPETGLPLNMNLNLQDLMASIGQIQPQGGDEGSGE